MISKLHPWYWAASCEYGQGKGHLSRDKQQADEEALAIASSSKLAIFALCKQP